MLKDLVLKNRSYRRFDHQVKIKTEMLTEFIELARNVPSGANLQPLKYMISNSEEKNAQIFECLRWAGYLPDWSGPKENERPTAYIVILGDTEIVKNFGVDHGIAAQTILLGATEKGFGGCIFGSIDRKTLRATLSIPKKYEILHVIALGKPKEKVTIEPIKENGSIRYYRDEEQIHHVPKRSLEEILLN